MNRQVVETLVETGKKNQLLLSAVECIINRKHFFISRLISIFHIITYLFFSTIFAFSLIVLAMLAYNDVVTWPWLHWHDQICPSIFSKKVINSPHHSQIYNLKPRNVIYLYHNPRPEVPCILEKTIYKSISSK